MASGDEFAAVGDDAVLRIDEASGVGPGEQIRLQLVELVSTGALRPGCRLPSVRALASSLGLAPNTVAKTYKALEQEGFLVTAGRHGTQVADQRVETTERTRQQLRAVLQPLLDDGWSTADVLRLVRSALGD